MNFINCLGENFAVDNIDKWSHESTSFKVITESNFNKMKEELSEQLAKIVLEDESLYTNFLNGESSSADLINQKLESCLKNQIDKYYSTMTEEILLITNKQGVLTEYDAKDCEEVDSGYYNLLNEIHEDFYSFFIRCKSKTKDDYYIPSNYKGLVFYEDEDKDFMIIAPLYSYSLNINSDDFKSVKFAIKTLTDMTAFAK